MAGFAAAPGLDLPCPSLTSAHAQLELLQLSLWDIELCKIKYMNKKEMHAQLVGSGGLQAASSKQQDMWACRAAL